MSVGGFLKTVGGGIVDGVKWLKPGGQSHLRLDKEDLFHKEAKDSLKNATKEEKEELLDKLGQEFEGNKKSSLEKCGLWIVDAGILVVGVLDGLDGLAPPTEGDDFTDGSRNWDHLDASMDYVQADSNQWSGTAADNYNTQIAQLKSQLGELSDLDSKMQDAISAHADTVRQMHDVIDGLLIGLFAARIAATAARFAGPEGKAISIAIQIAAVVAAVPTAVGMASNTGAKASNTADLIDGYKASYNDVATNLGALASAVDKWTPTTVSSQVGVMNSVDSTLNPGSFEVGDDHSKRDVVNDSTGGADESGETDSTSAGAHINFDIGRNREPGAVIVGGLGGNTNGAAGGLPSSSSSTPRGDLARNSAGNRAPLGSALTTDRRNNDDSDDTDGEPRFARPRLVELIALSAEATHMTEYFSDFASSMGDIEDQFLGSVDKVVSAAQHNQPPPPPPPAPAADAASSGAGPSGEAGQRAPIDVSTAVPAPQQDLSAAQQVL